MKLNFFRRCPKVRPDPISIIITTYNRPHALARVLTALEEQDEKAFEVIIADDGSTPETAEMIKALSHHLSYPLRHVWQLDEGFQAAKIRNKAAALAQGEYLIFLDGDCIPSRSFVKKHRQLAEAGWFVTGNRILLSSDFTTQAIEKKLPLHTWQFSEWRSVWKTKHCNRLLPIFYLPLGILRKIFYSSWKGAKTCNLGLWKNDFMTLNGFDESFIGWGYEDSHLIVRLFKINIFRKEGRFAAPVFHLWHSENDRSTSADNYQKFLAVRKSSEVRAPLGVDQYLEKPRS